MIMRIFSTIEASCKCRNQKKAYDETLHIHSVHILTNNASPGALATKYARPFAAPCIA